MSKTIRFVSVLGLAAIAAASQAITVNIISGAMTGATNVGSFNTSVQVVGGTSPFSNVLVGSNAPVVINGAASTISYTTPSSGNFTITFNSNPDTQGNAAASFTSPALVTAATGQFTQFLNVPGLVIGGTTSPSSGGGFVLGGTITPEPASLAALGVGAVALLRRRRKA